jgi:8-oxo-dGTP pyrophosphatase MutT (NUDIX family)
MNDDYFIVRDAPKNFNPIMEAAGCCCQFQKTLLMLKRHPHKPYGNMWGVPGGKMELHEDMRACAVREIYEEAGIDINDDGLIFMGSLYCRINQENKPFEYIFHLFLKKFRVQPELKFGLSEHVESKWVSVEEAYQLPLIIGGREVLEFFADSLYTQVNSKIGILRCGKALF